MLVQFVVENFLSFKNEAILNMTATSDSSHETHVIHDEQGKKISTLRAAALYGANAAGKSNIVKAIEFAKNLIINGTRPNDFFHIIPFKLDPETYGKPSKFEFTIKHDGVLYIYGFVVDNQKIVEEWLFANLGKREVSFFERTTDEKGKVEVAIGPQLATKSSKQAGFLEYIAQGTRPNQLFLTEANEKNVEQIKPLMLWFQNFLTILQHEKRDLFVSWHQLPQRQHSEEILFARLEEEPELKEFISHFLRTSLKEIKSIYVHKYVSPALNQSIGRRTPKEALDDKEEEMEIHYGLITLHGDQINRKKSMEFEVREESDGTQRLIQILPVIYDAVTKGKVFVIDELERSLHPLLSRLFLQAFLNTEPNKGQIIFTTHETTLMDLELLRRDEIWFAEKDEEESSRIYSLAEFRVRNDLKIDKGYLQGRFGAIPFFGDADRIGIGKES